MVLAICRYLFRKCWWCNHASCVRRFGNYKFPICCTLYNWISHVIPKKKTKQKCWIAFNTQKFLLIIKMCIDSASSFKITFKERCIQNLWVSYVQTQNWTKHINIISISTNDVSSKYFNKNNILKEKCIFLNPITLTIIKKIIIILIKEEFKKLLTNQELFANQ